MVLIGSIREITCHQPIDKVRYFNLQLVCRDEFQAVCNPLALLDSLAFRIAARKLKNFDFFLIFACFLLQILTGGGVRVVWSRAGACGGKGVCVRSR